MIKKEWDYWERNNGSHGIEDRYSCGDWQIVYNRKTKSGHIGKKGRITIVDVISKDSGKIEKGLGVPNYVVDKVNEILSNG
jgi:hypothetical protein